MRNPRSIVKPLAIGAPKPLLEIPVRPSRMIHFFDPSNPRMASKVPEIAKKVDVLLANLEDAIETKNKLAAREGLVKIAQATDFGDTQFWSRVNSLDSPWFLDDVLTIVGEAGHKLDVLMIPKVEGPWDIHFVDQLLAQLEAKHRLARPILIHAILETALGVTNVEEICAASPRMQSAKASASVSPMPRISMGSVASIRIRPAAAGPSCATSRRAVRGSPTAGGGRRITMARRLFRLRRRSRGDWACASATP